MQAYESSPELYPGSHPDEVVERCAAAERAITKKMEPTAFEVYAYIDAAEAFRDFNAYEGKLPYGGGLMDQPYLWKLALDCMISAHREGRARAAWDARPEEDD